MSDSNAVACYIVAFKALKLKKIYIYKYRNSKVNVLKLTAPLYMMKNKCGFQIKMCMHIY